MLNSLICREWLCHFSGFHRLTSVVDMTGGVTIEILVTLFADRILKASQARELTSSQR